MCVGMSVFTHYWYPYIDEEGKKRSKTKPEEYVSISGCHDNALLFTFITGNQNQLYGDHAQQFAFDNLKLIVILFLFICIITYNLLQLGHSVNEGLSGLELTLCTKVLLVTTRLLDNWSDSNLFRCSLNLLTFLSCWLPP